MSFEQAVTDLETTNAALVQEVVRVRDAAMGLNRIYPDTAAGLAAVNDGQYFAVPGTGDTYMTLYRRNGTSANQISQYPSQAAVDGVVNLLGSAAYLDVMTSLRDISSDHLMPTGAFGVGKGLRVDNAELDTFLEPGFYFVNDGSVGKPTAQGGMVVVSGGGGYWMQTFSPRQGGSMYYRAKNGTLADWDNWDLLYSRANILGTVSQSGGVPTGAVIERGSNANGEYVKFADGTMICRRTIDLDPSTAGNFDISAYPASFASDPAGSFSVTGGFGAQMDVLADCVFAARNDRWRMRLTSSISGDPFQIALLAIGRWF